MGITTIEWTDHSINPFRARDKETGKAGHFCVKVSPGCKNCYSSRLQPRFGTFPFLVENRDKVEIFLDESKLEDVLRRRVPTKYFWCDMTDMFYDDYPDEWIDHCFATMALTPQHTHQVLTKRADRMMRYFTENHGHEARRRVQDILAPTGNRTSPEADKLFDNWPLPNVWCGVSVEDQQRADERIPLLLQTPAFLRFVSYEPALGPVNFQQVLWNQPSNRNHMDVLRGGLYHPIHGFIKQDVNTLDWIIVGGESGPGARPFQIEWAKQTIEQCAAAKVACFMKQFGAKPVADEPLDGKSFEGRSLVYACQGIKGADGQNLYTLLLDNKKGGNWDEWPSWARVREFPYTSVQPGDSLQTAQTPQTNTTPEAKAKA